MTSISLPGASGSRFVRSVFTCWACVAVQNPKVKRNTEIMSVLMLCLTSVLSVMWCENCLNGSPEINRDRDLSVPPLHYLFPGPLFGRETHASTIQSEPVLLPTRNGPC